MRRPTLTVAAVGLVAAAAIASSVKSAVDGHASSGSPRAAAEPAPPTASISSATSTASAGTVRIGDIRRLPKPRAGDLHGALAVWSDGQCLPVVMSLDRLVSTTAGTMRSACAVWTSPAGTMLGLVPFEEEQLYAARAITGRGSDTGLAYVQFNPPFVTVADDGAVAICDTDSVLLSRRGRVQVVRRFPHRVGAIDPRCVTGAIGATIVRLSADRRRLVDVVDGRTVRRLALPVRQQITAIAASSDGFVAIADAADDTLAVTVYRPDGEIATPRRRLPLIGDATKLLLARGGSALAFETTDDWLVTNLANGRTLSSPGGALVTDVAFSPDASAVAATTLNGIVFASLPDLAPRWFIDFPSQSVAWFDAGRFPHSRTAPL